ncbi:aldo/keto reductase [Streptomyces sp. NPDC058464]|uniref:aldo/keto reductase n=1 Tax=Streptomyces sp. NPDC058464 TaxID=3346511 RepID=UPI003669346F
MQMKELGRSGFTTSEFIFGAGSIGGVGSSKETLGRGITAEQGMDRLDEAVQLGVRLIDTADSYAGGRSERAIGEWLADRAPGDVLVATKVGNTPRGTDLSRSHIERQLAQSIGRLGRVDLYLSHAPDPSTPVAETLEAFTAAREAGSIKAFGVSNVDAPLLEEILSAAESEGLARPEWVQNSFSLLDREAERELLPLVIQEGLGFTPFSPLAGGVLSERYLDGRPVESGSRIAVAGDLFYAGMHSPENLKRVGALRVLARERDISVSAMALAWLRTHPGVTAPIVAPSRADQWKAVQEALATDLDEAELALISDIFSPVGR